MREKGKEREEGEEGWRKCVGGSRGGGGGKEKEGRGGGRRGEEGREGSEIEEMLKTCEPQQSSAAGLLRAPVNVCKSDLYNSASVAAAGGQLGVLHALTTSSYAETAVYS